MMSLEDVRRYLAEAEALGVKEYYFTGGEPLLNREIFEMLEAALALGPVSVLTNGVLIRPETAQRLRSLSDGSDYSLDLRISIDGWDAATNDPIRGAGTFERILAGIRNLAAAGLNPVVTVTEALAGAGTSDGRARLLAFLRDVGLAQPRLKVMPLLRLGAEMSRSRAYQEWESLRGRTLTAPEAEALQCSSCRMATGKGVYVCPILIDFPGARMGATLAETRRSFPLSYAACFTCHEQGLSCRT
jgi:MoaA/NifB/PqqE/SkfB family radical SAM enzyme